MAVATATLYAPLTKGGKRTAGKPTLANRPWDGVYLVLEDLFWCEYGIFGAEVDFAGG
ncbi:hypothetical protein KDA_44480 [Dictyobacter alpinus]|uniref:Uncharacterized protein n=1 Tax=Dictyobacter alpinus TaxID=2014873 RepID=A0A402BCA0_9CHLR|nr:hypothetical protein KDA_44480 [Dictyobacter alpinus]